MRQDMLEERRRNVFGFLILGVAGVPVAWWFYPAWGSLPTGFFVGVTMAALGFGVAGMEWFEIHQTVNALRSVAAGLHWGGWSVDAGESASHRTGSAIAMGSPRTVRGPLDVAFGPFGLLVGDERVALFDPINSIDELAVDQQRRILAVKYNHTIHRRGRRVPGMCFEWDIPLGGADPAACADLVAMAIRHRQELDRARERRRFLISLLLACAVVLMLAGTWAAFKYKLYLR